MGQMSFCHPISSVKELKKLQALVQKSDQFSYSIWLWWKGRCCLNAGVTWDSSKQSANNCNFCLLLSAAVQPAFSLELLRDRPKENRWEQLQQTGCLSCWTVLIATWKLFFSRFTSVHSALGGFVVMCYINIHVLLTLTLTKNTWAHSTYPNQGKSTSGLILSLLTN